MLDFAALPPEINSGLMYAGPGSGPMLVAAVAWDVLAADLYSTAASYGSVTSDLASGWLGPSSIAMAAAAAPYVSWMSATAGQAAARGAQAKAAAAAYEAAFAMTVPPPVIAANRALLMLLTATNFFGQNTPAIMATEAQYMEMWAQDAAAMYGYAAASQAASTFTPFMSPLLNTNPAGVGAQGAAVAQAAGSSAGTATQTVSPLTTAMSAPLSAAVPNAGLASTAPTMSSSSSMSPLSSLTTLTSSASPASGAGSSASISTSGTSMIGSAGALMRSVGPATSIFGNQFQASGSAVGNGFGSGTGVFAAPGMGSAVTGGVGRAASVGMLSVPQGWASAAPAFNQVASALPVTSAGTTPAVVPGGPGGTLGGMPMLANAMRGMGNPMPPSLRIGFRPTVVSDHVYGG